MWENSILLRGLAHYMCKHFVVKGLMKTNLEKSKMQCVQCNLRVNGIYAVAGLLKLSDGVDFIIWIGFGQHRDIYDYVKYFASQI